MIRVIAILIATAFLAACSNEPDCSPQSGFEAGLSGQPAESSCDEARFVYAWRLGQSMHEMQTERDELLQRESELEPVERARLRVLERDLPELQTLARIEGLLPPAEFDPES